MSLSPATVSTIADSVFVRCDNPALAYTGAHVSRCSRFQEFLYTPDSVTSAYAFPPYFAGTVHTGSAFEVLFKGIPGNMFRLMVDGVAVGPPPAPVGPADGNLYLLRIDFGSVARRKILLKFDHVPFGGLRIGPTDMLARSPAGSARAIFFGDSVTVGTGATASFTSYVFIAGSTLGWRSWASGAGGTGYCNPGKNSGDVTYGDRLQHDLIQWNPTQVVIQGGSNDHAYPDSDISAGAFSLYSTIRQALPEVPIYVWGPWSPWATPPDRWLAIRDDLRTAAANVANCHYIDNLAEQWVTSANQARIVAPDGFHPNQAGHALIGQRLASDIAALSA
jgi:lysophospholipase L1-like esterase